MGFKSSSILCLAILLAVSSSIHAMDVAKLLAKSPEFAAFTKALTETKLVDQINSRNSITILALNDGAMGGLSGKSPAATKAILSTHVILDFFDEKKLMEAQGSGQLLTTLYQASGLAQNQQGFVKVALVGEGEIAFGSAVKGSPVDVELVKTVVSQPYNISILQVARPITFAGVDSPVPANASANAKAPAGSATATANATATAKAPVASASAPMPAKGAAAKAPASQAPAQDAAVADAPTTGAETPTSQEVVAPTPSSVAPLADTPAEGPIAADVASPSLAPGPADGEVAADAKPPAASASKTLVGLVGAFMCLASMMVVM